MTRNILIIIFFFCLILSNLCCAKKSTIVTKNGFDANSSFSSSVNTFSPIEVSVHIRANKENSDVRITYTPQKELDLVRVEFNGERIFKNEEIGNWVGFNHTTTFKKDNRLVLTSYNGNIRNEYVIEIPIKPLDFESEKITDFDKHKTSLLHLSRIPDNEESLHLKICSNTTNKANADLNETKDAIVFSPQIVEKMNLGKCKIILKDFKQRNGMSDDGLVLIRYNTLYESEIELNITN